MVFIQNQQKAPPMPNNQDAVKLPPYVARRDRVGAGNFKAYVTKGPHRIARFDSYDEAVQVCAALNTCAPTPREQELEAQNKALIAIAEHALFFLSDKLEGKMLDDPHDLAFIRKTLGEIKTSGGGQK